jgi:hypothetical protein
VGAVLLVDHATGRDGSLGGLGDAGGGVLPAVGFVFSVNTRSPMTMPWAPCDLRVPVFALIRHVSPDRAHVLNAVQHQAEANQFRLFLHAGAY